jgi:transposase
MDRFSGAAKPAYGRGPRGARVIDDVPQGTWKTITFVAALRHDKMVAPMVLDGPMTGEMFLAYVKHCLVPTLKRNDIVVIDNLRAHKVAGVREAIETARATLRYLPQYSPDLNPIEMPLSKFKTFLRRSLPGPSQRCVAASSYSLLHPASSPSRMCQLFQTFRPCFHMTGIRCSAPPLRPRAWVALS